MPDTDTDRVFISGEIADRYRELQAICLSNDSTPSERHVASVELQGMISEWKRLNEERRLDWRQRRFIRNLMGGEPLTSSSGCESRARAIAEDDAEARAERIARKRLIRLYGTDGATAIYNLRDRLWRTRWQVPADVALRWAEQKYARGEALTP